jgi:hypothetical protein
MPYVAYRYLLLPQVILERDATKQRDLRLLKILSNIFLPSGYPASVSPGT